MKKLLTVMATLCLLAACNKQPVTEPIKDPIKEPVKEKPRTKKTTFRVFQYEDYSAPVYDSTYAEVELALYKKSFDSAQTKVWDTVLRRQHLRLFPTNAQPLMITKTIDSIYEEKEWLIAVEIIHYDSYGFPRIFGEHIPYRYNVDSLLLNVSL